MHLGDIADDRQEELQSAIKEAAKANNQTTALSLLLDGLSSVRDSISDSAVDHITVNNLDEVKAALRNELNRISKPIIKAISQLSLDKKQIESITSRIENDNKVALSSSHDIQIIKRPKERVFIENLRDLVFPDDVTVNNLFELKKYFDELATKLQGALKVNVPAPQVTVNPPTINIPEIKMPESSVKIDMSSVIKALEPLKFISPMKNKPIAVRLSDGQVFIKALKTFADNQERQTTAFSSGLTESSARKAFKTAVRGVVAGSASLELTSAGTAVQLSAASVGCKYVDISVNGGLANLGSSVAGTVATSGAEVGITLFPGNLPYRVDADNLNQVYVAGASGSRLSYVFYN